MVEGRTLTAGIMFAVFVVMVGLALTYPQDARFLPLVIGIPGLVLSGAQLAIELRTRPDKEFTAENRKAEWKMFGWFVLFVVVIILFGFPYAGPIMVAVYLHFSWRERWYVSLGSALFAWAVLYGVFEYVLGLPLFEGLVFQWIFG
ncbi:MAG TPA: tripartite tricarboxylate transporter TctB family protein [Micropepsaceae bacterium]|nr:tripartite tricarboxylate transporter TctB family protein [Micropepsaceae bacterium]